MNWDALGAIGELVGATAVLFTIVYIAIQVKKTSDAARSQSLASAQQINLEETKLWLDHFDLIAKANSQEPLSAMEISKLQELVGARHYSAFLGHGRSNAVGTDNNWYNATNFANLLHRNPGVGTLWVEMHEDAIYRNPDSKRFAVKVMEHLENIDVGPSHEV